MTIIISNLVEFGACGSVLAPPHWANRMEHQTSPHLLRETLWMAWDGPK